MMAGSKLTTGIALVVGAGFMLTGCGSTGSSEFIGNEPPVREAVEPVQEPKFEPLPEPEPEALWICTYSPTYDDDWHNDVVCSNGVDSERPYLREWDSFVTEDEILESASEYEDQLNAGL